jgi:hypothetical protein
MARHIQVQLIDDLDGGPAAETIRFALGDAPMEIELSEGNAVQFRAVLAPYVKAARIVRTSRPGKRPGKSPAPAAKAVTGPRRAAQDPAPTTAEVREWARGQGIEVSGFGRISGDLMVRFQEAQSAGPGQP